MNYFESNLSSAENITKSIYEEIIEVEPFYFVPLVIKHVDIENIVIVYNEINLCRSKYFDIVEKSTFIINIPYYFSDNNYLSKSQRNISLLECSFGDNIKRTIYRYYNRWKNKIIISKAEENKK